jgi:hypothetical protein
MNSPRSHHRKKKSTSTTTKRKVFCRPGYMKRFDYVVVTDSSGKRKKIVRTSCIKKNKKKRTTKKMVLHKGTLRQFGYDTTDKSMERQKALSRAVRNLGWLVVFRKLNAVAILTKRSNPTKSKIFSQDKAWVRKKYYKKNQSTKSKTTKRKRAHRSGAHRKHTY